jgi:hypothetical protein
LTTPDEESGAGEARGDLNPAALFAIVWDAVAETLGTAGTAAIVRRAAARAAMQSRELVDLVIHREKLEYRYTLPHAWSHPDEAATTARERAPLALRALIAEIGRVLVELTGTIVVGRLEQIPELRAGGLVWRSEEAN